MKRVMMLMILGIVSLHSFGLEPDKKTVKGMWSSTVVNEYSKEEGEKKSYSYEFESTLSLLNNTFIWEGMELSGLFSIEDNGKRMVFVDGDHNETMRTTWYIKKLTNNKLILFRLEEQEGCEYRVEIEFERM